jgi:Acetyltransferase (GNAT) domain
MVAALQVRALEAGDVSAAAQILFDAFGGVYRLRGHTPPFPTLESAAWLCRAYLDLDPGGCALCEQRGVAVGVGFAHPRGGTTSIGPVAARPGAQRGIGRAIMSHFADLAHRSASVRLFQDSFNPDSFGLYTRMGYAVVDVAPYLLADRLVPPATPPGALRTVTPGDLGALERYDTARTGAERGRDLALLASTGAALVWEPEGKLSGYLFYRPLPARVIVGPAVADSPEGLGILLDAAAAALPGRAAVVRASAAAPAVLQRAFARGFRIDHLGNLMVKGRYAPPPAQLYALFPESL